VNDIFLSYANEDHDRARALAAALESQGWSVFWDRTIPSGKTWREVIGKALHDSRCVVVAWSKASIDSTWVREEADVGRERGVLHPVLLDDVRPPLGFREIQAANLIGWDSRRSSSEFERFVTDIKGTVGQPRQKKRSSGPGVKVKEGQPLGVGGIVVMALAGLQIVFWVAYISELLNQFSTGEVHIVFVLLVFISGVLLPSLGGALIMKKSLAAAFIFGVAGLCDVLVMLLWAPNFIVALFPFAVMNVCACILSAWRFRSRRQSITLGRA